MDLSHPFSIINNYIDCFVGASEDERIEAYTSVVKVGKQIINLQCDMTPGFILKSV